MEVVHTAKGMRELVSRWRGEGLPVALVPTMGALHRGHLSLVEAARSDPRAKVVVSIFVNPLQFGPGEDFERYPRSLEGDLAILREASADAVFHPTVEEMYPAGFATRVTTGAVAQPLEGEARPGHFDGVATVVARLFGITRADRAYFGQKDAQQLAVIRRLVADLAIPVEVVGCPTVREADGLAMSSRNRYLDGPGRALAVALVRALAEAQAAHQASEIDPGAIEARMRRVLAAHPGVEVEYARVVDAASFVAPGAGARRLAVIAARVGSTRLIDNAFLDASDVVGFRMSVPDGAVAV